MSETTDTWVDGPKIGEVGLDSAANKFVLVTNGRCTLDHTSPDAYAAAHAGSGCVLRPSEGLVFTFAEGVLVGWSQTDVSGRSLSRVPDDIGSAIIAYYKVHCEEIAKTTKKKRRKSADD